MILLIDISEPRINQYIDIAHACSLNAASLVEQPLTLRELFNQREEK